MRQRWKCVYCGDILVSDSKERHKMDMCKCGKSGVDLEEYYSRWIGNPELLEEVCS
jgi:hypothetical protein